MEFTQSTPQHERYSLEYPLGSPLTPEQLQVIARYVADEPPSGGKDDSPDAPKYETYNPELGLAALTELHFTTNLKGMVNNEDVLKYVASDEARFQAAMCGTLLKYPIFALKMPRLHEALAGTRQSKEIRERLISSYPDIALKYIPHYSQQATPEELIDVTQRAYANLKASEFPLIAGSSMSAQLTEIIGQNQILRDIQESLQAGRFFDTSAWISIQAQKAVDLGAIPPEEAIDIVISAGGLPSDTLLKLVRKSEDPNSAWKVVQQKASELYADELDRHGPLSLLMSACFMNTSNEFFDPDFAHTVISEIAEKSGPPAALSKLLPQDSWVDQALLEDIRSSTLVQYYEASDASRKTRLAVNILDNRGHFDEMIALSVLEELASIAPSIAVEQCCYIFYEDPDSPIIARCRELLTDKLEQVDDELVGHMLKRLIAIFPEHLEYLTHRAVDTSLFMDSTTMGLTLDILKDRLGEDALCERIYARIEHVDPNDIEAANAACKISLDFFGIEATKQLFFDRAVNLPSSTLSRLLLEDHHLLFSDSECEQLFTVAYNDGCDVSLIEIMPHLRFRLSRELIITLFENAAHSHPLKTVDYLGDVSTQLSYGNMTDLLDLVTKRNPAAILFQAHLLAPGHESKAESALDYMRTDPRRVHAPHFFKKAIKHMEKSPNTVSYLVWSRQIETMYNNINIIVDHGAEDMLQRIRESAGKTGESAEEESIYLACSIITRGIDQDEIQNYQDAQLRCSEIIRYTLGLRLCDTDEDTALFAKRLGSCTAPILAYIEHVGSPDQVKDLAEIVGAIGNDNYTKWRYGDLEELVARKILPNIDKPTYSAWQDTHTSQGAASFENDPGEISHRIQQTISNILSVDSDAAQDMIIEAKRNLAHLGMSIALLHEQKAAGKVSADIAKQRTADIEAEKIQAQAVINAARLSRISEAEVSSGVLFNEKNRPTKISVAEALEQASEHQLLSGDDRVAELQQLLVDHRQAVTTDIGRITVRDVDDFQTLLEIGDKPVSTCQHFASGIYREGLLGHFEPNVKVITVENEKGKLVARSIIRLLGGADGEPILTVEPVHMSQPSKDIERAILAHARLKASLMNTTAYKVGYPGRRDIKIRAQRFTKLYSDAFGGIHSSDARPAAAPSGFVPV